MLFPGCEMFNDFQYNESRHDIKQYFRDDGDQFTWSHGIPSLSSSVLGLILRYSTAETDTIAAEDCAALWIFGKSERQPESLVEWSWEGVDIGGDGYIGSLL